RVGDFKNVRVLREKGRIDILIYDGSSNRAIVIENKISNAVDQERQIRRYLDYVEEQGWEAVAVVYLTLRGALHGEKKWPAEINWHDSDKPKVEELLVAAAACDGSPTSMENGWLKKCEDATNNADALFSIRQYRRFLQYWKGKVMDYALMEKFFEILKGDAEWQNYKTASSIQSMMGQQVEFRSMWLAAEFHKIGASPFDNIGSAVNKSGTIGFSAFTFASEGVHLDVRSTESIYELRFWDQGLEAYGTKRLDDFVNWAHLSDRVIKTEDPDDPGEYYSKTFIFPEEHCLVVDEVRLWMKHLRKYPGSLKG
ncbi:MAG: PD-(D/E)XK nuclease family protein, partial [Opitutales bacterium]